MTSTTRIIILGGGFGGIYTAIELEKIFKNRQDIQITLVNQDNFLLFTPMLHEVAASDLDPSDIVNPIHKLLHKTQFFCGSVDAVDLKKRVVTVSHGIEFHSHELRFDHLVLSLGTVTHFYGLPGLMENALTMKSLGDAIYLRNRMISLLEEADFECSKQFRNKLLTVVVAGGGFAGVETVAAIHDFLNEVVGFYPNLSTKNIKVVLAHSGKTILPELNESLGIYAGRLLEKRGVEIRYQTRVQSFEDNTVIFSDGTSLKSSTVVWTAGSAPNPLIATIDCSKEKGRVLVNKTLELPDYPNVWALGDCAAIPKSEKEFQPPTAQHAIREAKTVARNIAAKLSNRSLSNFNFKTIGQLASLGHRKGVAQVFGLRFSGFFAWWLWRTVYLLKLPRFEKRMRVAINWTLDVLFSKDNVQLPSVQSTNMRAPMGVQYTKEINHESSNAGLGIPTIH